MMGSLEFSENQLRLYVRSNQCASRASSANASPNCSPLARVACDPVRVRLRRAFANWCVEEQPELVSEAPRETASDFVTPLVTPYSTNKCSGSGSASAERSGAEATEEMPVLVCAAARRLNIDGDGDEERSAAPARNACGKHRSNLTSDPTSPCKLSKP